MRLMMQEEYAVTTTRPLKREHHYVGKDNAEIWCIGGTQERFFDCRRRCFANVGDHDTYVAKMRQAADLVLSDPARSDELVHEANALLTEYRLEVGSRSEAVTFFADGRQDREREAYDFVAEINPTMGNFGSG
jgi:hypothetical protein